jgi:ribosomal protein S11
MIKLIFRKLRRRRRIFITLKRARFLLKNSRKFRVSVNKRFRPAVKISNNNLFQYKKPFPRLARKLYRGFFWRRIFTKRRRRFSRSFRSPQKFGINQYAIFSYKNKFFKIKPFRFKKFIFRKSFSSFFLRFRISKTYKKRFKRFSLTAHKFKLRRRHRFSKVRFFIRTRFRLSRLSKRKIKRIKVFRNFSKNRQFKRIRSYKRRFPSFRRKALARFFRPRRIRATFNRLKSLFSNTWSPINLYVKRNLVLKNSKSLRSSSSGYFHSGFVSGRLFNAKRLIKKAKRNLKLLYFVKLVQTYNNFFLHFGNTTSNRIYFTFTAGRVPVLRRNRRKTVQTLGEASDIFSRKIKLLKIKKLQLWVVGPISYFVRKFVKIIKSRRLRITLVNHFLLRSHNGVKDRKLRRV